MVIHNGPCQLSDRRQSPSQKRASQTWLALKSLLRDAQCPVAINILKVVRGRSNFRPLQCRADPSGLESPKVVSRRLVSYGASADEPPLVFDADEPMMVISRFWGTPVRLTARLVSATSLVLNYSLWGSTGNY